jgi:hypothetical protein
VLRDWATVETVETVIGDLRKRKRLKKLSRRCTQCRQYLVLLYQTMSLSSRTSYASKMAILRTQTTGAEYESSLCREVFY